MTATRMLAVNEMGIRVGEDHWRAKLTNAEVDRILDLHEEEGVGYKRLAAIFAVSTRTVRDICAYRKRAQHAADFRRGIALTVEQRRELYPEQMGPTFALCTGCHSHHPFRETQPLGAYRWCQACYPIALKYAKSSRIVKNCKNMPQTQLFAQEYAK